MDWNCSSQYPAFDQLLDIVLQYAHHWSDMRFHLPGREFARLFRNSGVDFPMLKNLEVGDRQLSSRPRALPEDTSRLFLSLQRSPELWAVKMAGYLLAPPQRLP
jgi:hypothetical protein